MTKKQITPKQAIYRLSYMSNAFSISAPFNTLAEAKHEAYKLMYDKTASDIKITKYNWKNWYKGDNSPTPNTKVVWKVNNQKGVKNDEL